MSHAELIRRLEALPAAQQAEVYDFVEFLASRQAAGQAPAEQAEHEPPDPALRPPRKPVWLDKPFVVPGFTPMSREEANARP
jgi:hypothetical protein